MPTGDSTISSLPVAGTLIGTEIYPSVQAGVTVRGTLNDIKAFIVSSVPTTRTKVKGSAIVTGGSITLPNIPMFIYSIFAGALPLQLTDDYTTSGTTLTPTNPGVLNGDKIYYVYEY